MDLRIKKKKLDVVYTRIMQNKADKFRQSKLTEEQYYQLALNDNPSGCAKKVPGSDHLAIMKVAGERCHRTYHEKDNTIIADTCIKKLKQKYQVPDGL